MGQENGAPLQVPAWIDCHPGKQGGAVVISGDPVGLGIVRSLGRRGIPAWVLGERYLTANFSRYTRRRLVWPAEDEVSRLEYLLELADRNAIRGWAIFPTTDSAASFLATHHGTLSERYQLTVPPWDTMQWAHDKHRTYQFASDLGIPVPYTRHPRDQAEVAALDCPFPAILKPAVKVAPNPFTLARAWRVDDRRELLARYDEACGFVPADAIMIQELIPGGGEGQVSFAALCLEGVPLAWLTARRVRQYPVDFGRFSTFVETIDEPALVEVGTLFLEALRYTGLAELEFKQDMNTGEYKLLDFNARAWGWHSIGPAAGTDFPYLLWLLVAGNQVQRAQARAGVRWVRLGPDLRAAAQLWRLGELSPRAYTQSLRPPLVEALAARDDPLPFLADVPMRAFLKLASMLS